MTAKLISSFVFATRIVQSLYFLNPKFQASSHLLWLYSPVCVGPGRKPRRPVFSQRGSNAVTIIRVTRPCNVLPLTSNFYIATQSVYPRTMLWAKLRKISSFSSSENYHFYSREILQYIVWASYCNVCCILTFFHHSDSQTFLESTELAAISSSFVHWAILIC